MKEGFFVLLLYMKPLHLVYVGKDYYRRQPQYEFYFSSQPESACGRFWENICAYNVEPPADEFVDSFAVLSAQSIEFGLLEEDEQFRYLDGVYGVIALAWEHIDDYKNLDSLNVELMTFRYGESLVEVEKKLQTRGLQLEFREYNVDSEYSGSSIEDDLEDEEDDEDDESPF